MSYYVVISSPCIRYRLSEKLFRPLVYFVIFNMQCSDPASTKKFLVDCVTTAVRTSPFLWSLQILDQRLPGREAWWRLNNKKCSPLLDKVGVFSSTVLTATRFFCNFLRTRWSMKQTFLSVSTILIMSNVLLASGTKNILPLESTFFSKRKNFKAT